MRIECFLVMWNEIDLVKLVVSHHQEYCDKLTILDNYSTDGSAELALKMGCEVVQFGTKFFDDSENQKIKNSIWKGSKSDWVYISDFDEIPMFLDDEGIHPGTPSGIATELLTRHQEGHTIYRSIGWQVMSEDMPKESLLEIVNGYRFDNYSKVVFFRPDHIKEMNYGLGSHDCKPTGNVVWNKNDWYHNDLYLMHYKHIGGVQRTINRYKEYKPRMSKFNRKHGHGSHYNRTVASLKQEWTERMAKSSPLI